MNQRPIWEALSRAHSRLGIGNVVPDTGNAVLAYHSVGGQSPERITREKFRSHLEFLTDAYEVADLVAVRESTGPKQVALTFDDGTRDFYHTVLPILEEFDVPATVFLIGDALREKAFQHDGAADYEYLTVEEARELAAHDLVSVGNHTLSHPHLPNRSRAEQHTEIRGGKQVIEDLLDVDVSGFCYPYCEYDATSAAIVAETHDLAVGEGGLSRPVEATTTPIPRLNGSVDVDLLRWNVHDASSVLWRPASALSRRLRGGQTGFGKTAHRARRFSQVFSRWR